MPERRAHRIPRAFRHANPVPYVFLAARMATWSLVLPLLKYVLPLPRLVRLMWAPGQGERQRERELQIATLARRIYRARPSGFRDNCLERSLLTYRYLSRDGADPRLVVGVRRKGRSVSGHVWVSLDGEPLNDSLDAIADFSPVIEFGPRGATTS